VIRRAKSSGPSAAASPGANWTANTEATYMYRTADDIVPSPAITYATAGAYTRSHFSST